MSNGEVTFDKRDSTGVFPRPFFGNFRLLNCAAFLMSVIAKVHEEQGINYLLKSGGAGVKTAAWCPRVSNLITGILVAGGFKTPPDTDIDVRGKTHPEAVVNPVKDGGCKLNTP